MVASRVFSVGDYNITINDWRYGGRNPENSLDISGEVREGWGDKARMVCEMWCEVEDYLWLISHLEMACSMDSGENYDGKIC